MCQRGDVCQYGPCRRRCGAACPGDGPANSPLQPQRPVAWEKRCSVLSLPLCARWRRTRTPAVARAPSKPRTSGQILPAGVTQPAGAGLGVKPQGLPPSAPLGSQPCPARSEVRTRRARWPRRLTPAETRFWLGICHGKSSGCSSEAPEHSQPQRSASRKQAFREDAQEKPLCSRVELGAGKWLREPVRRGGRAQAGCRQGMLPLVRWQAKPQGSAAQQ